MDDVCTGVKIDEFDLVLNYHSSVETSIQLTIEKESEQGIIPFLDIEIQHHNDGSLLTTVYRKPTHKDQFLNIFSHHPTCCNKVVIKHKQSVGGKTQTKDQFGLA